MPRADTFTRAGPRGGRASRDKGNRLERAVVRLAQDSGFGAERVPLSGSAGGRFSGDISIPILGVDRTVECKSRADGEPRDPWVFQLAIDVLLGEEIHTFASSSWGGRKAIGALIEDFACAPEARQGRLPIVALESDSYPHKTYGRVKEPVLRIVDWSRVPAAELLPAADLRTTAEILDDDIPF